ncbi:glutamyl-tRNA reductase [Ferruginibacter albus]|uniref:glutamyl-tRNA reductase n=1 Tax=Ferruginibacter albus TaxID=2875540 RepID=UPI001CC50813|nr:glutamyl-tRNA reductase [Ferruginibacter albus]UAY51620.1 glutamyl-tRNA reductase [Ferruginibacter albus]
MTGTAITDVDHFFIAGINYKKTDVSIRGQFAINTDQYNALLSKATDKGLTELFVLSTCNRTEIYGVANEANDLIEILCNETTGNTDTFNELAYVKKGSDAVEHLFSVAAGLDSQILGDYEIVGQLKQAAKFAKERNFIGTFSERLINSVLQSSKSIKTNTELSGGTVSVSFAAVQFLRNTVTDIRNKNILLIGAGKIGRNTCKYLVSHFGASQITVINRTDETAVELAQELNIHQAPYSDLYTELEKADIVLVSTNASAPIILKENISLASPKILIDLSIPNNIDPVVVELPNVTLINVDELAKQKDETLQKREAEVPHAKQIIEEHINDFIDWHNMRRHVPVLKAVKKKLMEINQCDFFHDEYPPLLTPVANNTETIQKVINNMAVKLRTNNTKGCQYIEAINDYITSGSNS